MYFGTPEFAVPPLAALVNAGFDIRAVVTQPERAVGRGLKLAPSPVAEAAQKEGLKVLTPESVKTDEFILAIRGLQPELFVVAAYGAILPAYLLDIPRRGALNIHPSLLPRHRGASPIETAILEGDTETGVTITLMDEGMDHGPIVLQEKLPIAKNENRLTLSKKLAALSADLIVKTVPEWLAGNLQASPQQHAAATYTKLLTREDGHLYWSKPAEVLEREVRAYQGRPGSFTFWQKGEKTLRLKVEAARALPSDQPHPIGKVFKTSEEMLLVQTERGALALDRLRLEGKESRDSHEFLRGNPDIIGSILL